MTPPIDNMAQYPMRQPGSGILPGELLTLQTTLPKRPVTDVAACAVLCAIAAARTYGLMPGAQLEAEVEKAAEQWVMRSGLGRRRNDFKVQMLGAYLLAMLDPKTFHTMVREVFDGNHGR